MTTFNSLTLPSTKPKVAPKNGYKLVYKYILDLKLLQANGGVASSGLGGGLGGDGRSGVLGGLAGLGGDAGVNEDASGGGIGGGATGRHHPRPPPNYTSDPYR